MAAGTAANDSIGIGGVCGIVLGKGSGTATAVVAVPQQRALPNSVSRHGAFGMQQITAQEEATQACRYVLVSLRG